VLIDFTDSEIKALRVMVFMPVVWLAERKAQIISAANLSWHYRIPGTKLLLYSRVPLEGFGILEPTDVRLASEPRVLVWHDKTPWAAMADQSTKPVVGPPHPLPPLEE
jgi:hypothetical protein